MRFQEEEFACVLFGGYFADLRHTQPLLSEIYPPRFRLAAGWVGGHGERACLQLFLGIQVLSNYTKKRPQGVWLYSFGCIILAVPLTPRICSWNNRKRDLTRSPFRFRSGVGFGDYGVVHATPPVCRWIVCEHATGIPAAISGSSIHSQDLIVTFDSNSKLRCI